MIYLFFLLLGAPLSRQASVSFTDVTCHARPGFTISCWVWFPRRLPCASFGLRGPQHPLGGCGAACHIPHRANWGWRGGGGGKQAYWCQWKLRAGSHVTAERELSSRLSSQRGNKLLASPAMCDTCTSRRRDPAVPYLQHKLFQQPVGIRHCSTGFVSFWGLR